MSDINSVIISGFVSSQPEVKNSSETLKILKFRLASYQYHKTNDGFEKNPTFLEVQQFSQYADKIAERISKGDKVIVQGKLNVTQWSDSTGKVNYKPYILADKITTLIKGQGQTQEQHAHQPVETEPQQKPQTHTLQLTQPKEQPVKPRVVAMNFDEEIPF